MKTERSTKTKRLIRILLGFTILGISLILLAIFNPDFRHELSILKEKFLHGSKNTELSKSAEADTLKITIPSESFESINIHRDNAIIQGRLSEEQKEEFKATLLWKGEDLKCKLRLKGDFPDHWKGDKWSFRINVKGGQKLNRMDKFSIQDPSTRKELNEWYYHKILAHESLLALKYDFVHVVINEEYKGVYAIEESFAPEVLKENNRQIGPILKFQEAEWIEQITTDKDLQKDQTEVFNRAKITAFGLKKIETNRDLSVMFERGQNLLNGLRNGTKPLEDVIDIKSSAMLHALGDLTGSYHGLRWHNQRFYYNPDIDRLEMIGFDSGSGILITDIYLEKWEQNRITENEGVLVWKDRFFSSAAFRLAYIDALKKISRPKFLKNFNTNIETELLNYKYLMYQENNIYKFDLSVYESNAEVIRSYLDK